MQQPGSAADLRLVTAVAELHAAGVAVDWPRVLAGGRTVDLPVHPFQGRDYWLVPAARTAVPVVAVTEVTTDNEPEAGPRTATELVRLEAARVLGLTDPDDVLDDASFLELGFDSLRGVHLLKRLSTVTGLDLAPTLLFERTTPGLLAEHLDELLASDYAATDVYALLEELDELDEDVIATMTDAESETISAMLEKITAKWKARTV